MKRLFCMALILIMALPLAVSADYTDITSGMEYEEAIFDLSALGIMNGFEDGSFRPDETLTRAQFSKVAVCAMGMKNVSPVQTDFIDVPYEHWASGYIAHAKNAGIVNGIGDGLFDPEGSVKFPEAVKMVVCILGRKAEAEANGGYPNGYLAVASQCGLLKYLSVDDAGITRGESAQLIFNALDINLVEDTYSEVNGYRVTDRTLRYYLENTGDFEKVEGIVSATKYASLDSDDGLDDDFVTIDGITYRTADDMSEYLGYNVIAYVNSGKTPKLFSVQKYNNNVIKVDADKILEISATNVKWETESGDEDKLSINLDAVIYNGKRTDTLPKIYNGSYIFIDNDADNRAEVIEVKEYESFIIERTGTDVIYFANKETFRGRSAFKFDTDNDEIRYTITDYDGNAMDISDFKTGMSVTICASSDGCLVGISCGESVVSGNVTQINKSENKISIDDAEYLLTLKKDGNPSVSVKLGDYADFALDAENRIIGTIGDVSENMDYAYVVGVSSGSGLNTGAKLKVAKPGKREKETEIRAKTEYVTYKYSNSNLEILEFESKVKVDGQSVSSTEIDPRDYMGCVVGYTLSADGKIKKMNIYNIDISDAQLYNFNSDLQSFGGYVGRAPFFADEYTDILCVPENADSDRDWLEVVSVQNGASASMIPIAVDEDTQRAKAAVIVSPMDADSIVSIPVDQEISICWSISNCFIDGEEGYKVTVLTETEVEELYVFESASVSSRVANLKKGDLIKYSLDAFDRISNFELVANIRGLSRYYRANENSSSETVYGLCNTIEIRKLSEIRNELVDEISVVFNKDGSGQVVSYALACEEGPVVYKYSKRTGDVSVAQTDEIVSFEEAGSEATEVFMFVNNNDVEALVIIES